MIESDLNGTKNLSFYVTKFDLRARIFENLVIQFHRFFVVLLESNSANDKADIL
jgi:hypothetical protein